VFHSLQQLLEGLGDLIRQILCVLAEFRGNPIQPEHRLEPRESVLKKPGVVADVLDGSIDLVRDPGRELTDGFEFWACANWASIITRSVTSRTTATTRDS
jgi:hypothetical protein